ncbi:MAG TPA: peptidyl-prolyl cis-trans isomerase [Chthonomonadaceae bacterium]|nr:peptidyl-prolyl cis-trans isomerase [Chthonomonadaceae bacterium]
MAVTETSATHKIAGAAEKAAPARRRAATSLATETTRSWRLRIPPVVLILLALIVGLAIGVLVARQHYKAKNVVAAVNGEVITKDDLFRRMELAVGPQALHEMVGEELQLQFARKMGLAPTDAEVEAAFQRLSQQPHFTERLAASHQTADEIKDHIRIQLASAAVLGKGTHVTEADMRAFYNANIVKNDPRAKFYTPPTITVAVIRTRTEDEADKALHALTTGAAFATVVKDYSIDRGSKANNGVLPTIVRGRTRMSQIPGMEDALFQLQIGSQMGPRKFAGSWWIIRCLDKSAEVIQPFDKVKEDCRTGAMVMKGIPVNARNIQAEFSKFQKSANIQAFWPEYSQAIGVH